MRTRVAIIGSPDKDLAASTLERARRWLAERAEVVYAEITADSEAVLDVEPDMLFVLGGDGTLIAAAHKLRERQVPIVGINLGKLGFLAEFTMEQIEREGDFLFNGELPVTRRTLLKVSLDRPDGTTVEAPAVNDCVVLSGAPFRMIEISFSVDGELVGELRGDGLIIATASGSTAHNLSAGGPILEPTARSLIITPICPHALTFRPLVVDSQREILIRAVRANEGTSISVDGQVRSAFGPEDRLVITRYAADFLLVRNPRRSPWYALRRKLMWGEKPKNNV